jgi:hypothetical protein
MPALPHLMFSATEPWMAGVASDAGESLAKDLATACIRSGFECSAPNLWRDLGWEFQASRDGEAFSVRFAKYKKRSVLLAVPPADFSSYFGGSGRTPRAESGALRAVCAAIHECISKDGRFDSLSWMLGGPPEKVPKFATYAALAFRDGF